MIYTCWSFCTLADGTAAATVVAVIGFLTSPLAPRNAPSCFAFPSPPTTGSAVVAGGFWAPRRRLSVRTRTATIATMMNAATTITVPTAIMSQKLLPVPVWLSAARLRDDWSRCSVRRSRPCCCSSTRVNTPVVDIAGLPESVATTRILAFWATSESKSPTTDSWPVKGSTSNGVPASMEYVTLALVPKSSSRATSLATGVPSYLTPVIRTMVWLSGEGNSKTGALSLTSATVT